MKAWIEWGLGAGMIPMDPEVHTKAMTTKDWLVKWFNTATATTLKERGFIVTSGKTWVDVYDEDSGACYRAAIYEITEPEVVE